MGQTYYSLLELWHNGVMSQHKTLVCVWTTIVCLQKIAATTRVLQCPVIISSIRTLQHITHTGPDNAVCIILIYKVSCLSVCLQNIAASTRVLPCPVIISSIHTLQHITHTGPDNAMCICIILIYKVSCLSVCRF